MWPHAIAAYKEALVREQRQLVTHYHDAHQDRTPPHVGKAARHDSLGWMSPEAIAAVTAMPPAGVRKVPRDYSVALPASFTAYERSSKQTFPAHKATGADERAVDHGAGREDGAAMSPESCFPAGVPTTPKEYTAALPVGFSNCTVSDYRRATISFKHLSTAKHLFTASDDEAGQPVQTGSGSRGRPRTAPIRPRVVPGVPMPQAHPHAPAHPLPPHSDAAPDPNPTASPPRLQRPQSGLLTTSGCMSLSMSPEEIAAMVARPAAGARTMPREYAAALPYNFNAYECSSKQTTSSSQHLHLPPPRSESHALDAPEPNPDTPPPRLSRPQSAFLATSRSSPTLQTGPSSEPLLLSAQRAAHKPSLLTPSTDAGPQRARYRPALPMGSTSGAREPTSPHGLFGTSSPPPHARHANGQHLQHPAAAAIHTPGRPMVRPVSRRAVPGTRHGARGPWRGPTGVETAHGLLISESNRRQYPRPGHLGGMARSASTPAFGLPRALPVLEPRGRFPREKAIANASAVGPMRLLLPE